MARRPLDPLTADWIGQFYAYYQWQTGEVSRDIVGHARTFARSKCTHELYNYNAIVSCGVKVKGEKAVNPKVNAEVGKNGMVFR